MALEESSPMMLLLRHVQQIAWNFDQKITRRTHFAAIFIVVRHQECNKCVMTFPNQANLVYANRPQREGERVWKEGWSIKATMLLGRDHASFCRIRRSCVPTVTSVVRTVIRVVHWTVMRNLRAPGLLLLFLHDKLLNYEYMRFFQIFLSVRVRKPV